jgi:exodeoxyribonuclease VII large subunit
LNQPDPQAFSVAELTGHVKAILEGTFPNIWVEGEVSDLVRARSGHVYFTLKDDDAQIRGVIWRTTATRMRHKIENGQAVLCCGDVEVYAPRGTYQLVVKKVEPLGQGALQVAFQKLQAKLDREGLFSAERKRPLPRFPARIGVVTSPSGAAIQDFLEAAANRWPGVEIILIPAQVQGQGASETIESGIRTAQKIQPQLDVLVVTRGGGSLEDLWCFNEERVVRAVASSTIPTVSAVGHEVDITLCDLAADVRALTPTDGATRVLPDANLLDQTVGDLSRRLNRTIRSAIESRQRRVEALAARPILRKPHEVIHLRSRRLDELDVRAKRAMEGKLKLGRANLATLAASLNALSPLDVLSRGYSVTLDGEGQAIDDAKQLHDGDVIRTRLRKGEIESVVRKSEI